MIKQLKIVAIALAALWPANFVSANITITMITITTTTTTDMASAFILAVAVAVWHSPRG